MRWFLPILLMGCVPQPRSAQALVVHRGGAPSSLEALLDAAAGADAVCVGEHHDQPAHHGFQHTVLRHLVATRGDDLLALGLEMFQRPVQPVLDDYTRGALDEEGLYEASDWERRWGFPFEMYRPLFEDAHDYRVPLIALNAPRALTRAVARRGIAGLDERERAWLPEMDLGDAAHRRFFEAALPPGHAADQLYAAQVVWDETMAQTAAGVIARGARILILAGNAHCHARAIPARIERRLPEARALSVLLQERGSVASDFVVTLPDG